MHSSPNSSLFELQIDHMGVSYLRDAARWARFLAVVGFICIGLVALMGILFGTVFATVFDTLGSGAAFGGLNGIGLGAIYVIIALLQFFPCLYLNNFATKMKVALRNNDQVELNLAFKNMRAFYRFVGVLMIISIGLWIIGILIMIVAAVGRL